MIKKLLIALLLTFSFLGNLFAQNSYIPEKPTPQKLVNNFSKEFPNFISSEEEFLLEQKLESFYQSTSNQIVIVIIDDLNGYEPWEFATELGQKWGVGTKENNNGIVVLIKPTGGKGNRKYHIAVGYGLEGAIPDLATKRIQESELLPNFKQGRFYEGLDQTTDVLMALAKGEYNYKTYVKKSNQNGLIKAFFIVLIIIIFFIIKLKNNGGNGGSNNGRGGRMSYGSGIFWGSMMGSGFGGGSSSGSGGFGGFGGGGFGGGGSGGSW